MELLRKNSFILGFILGVCIPIAAYGILLTIYDFLDRSGIISDLGFSPDFRSRTLALFGLCTILIPFQIYRKLRFDDTMRGMVFPTMAYVGIWIYFFGRHLLNF
jgi:hypothetical protein